MVAVEAREDRTYLAADLPPTTTHAVIAPAWRWRALMEATSPAEADPLLLAVLELRDAGCGLRQISDMLQLPHDLIEYLGLRATTDRYTLQGDRQLTHTSAEVGWVYRDVLTDELVSSSDSARPPLNPRGDGNRLRLRIGTAGRPRDIHCVVLRANKPPPAPPSPVDLARLRRSKVVNVRISLIGAGEPCHLVHPTIVDQDEVIVVGRDGDPQIALTRSLEDRKHTDRAIRDWMDEAVSAREASREPRGAADPLSAASARLIEAGRDFRTSRNPLTAGALKRSIVLVLGRYCAEAWYRAGIEPHGTPQPKPSARHLAHALAIPEAVAARLTEEPAPGLDMLSRDVVRLLIDTRRLSSDFPAVDARRLALAASELADLMETDSQYERLERLIRDITDLVEVLLKPGEGSNGVQPQ